MWCTCVLQRGQSGDGSCVCVLQRGQSGDGSCEALTLCRYGKRKGDLFVLS